MSIDQITTLSDTIELAFYAIGGALLLIEIAKALFERPVSPRGFLDMVASISTQIPTILFEALVMTFAYTGYVLLAEAFVTWTMPITVGTILLTLLVCDFVYYWEHRLAHEVRALWTQHAVHHSSRHYNTAVALRFGPFEGAWSALIHLPLVFLGFPPELIFFSVIAVLAYQTWIHTELIGRLGVLDSVLNTPSNHRVHHGCDDKYIDKNYGGVLILWDRLFGTYQAEEETPRYGLKRDFDSVNPLAVWFSELPRFFGDALRARNLGELSHVLFGKPGEPYAGGQAPDKRDG